MIRPYTREKIKTSITIRKSSYRRLQAACRVLKRNRRYFSENRILCELLKAYLKAWRGKPASTRGPRRYNLTGKKYAGRAIYLEYTLYRAAWFRGSHSGESVSRMIDFSIRHLLPRVLASLLVVAPKSPCETKNSEYWRRRWYCRKRPRPEIFLNYVEYGSGIENRGQIWNQTLNLRQSNHIDIPPWDLKSCFAYLYNGENAIYTPP